MKRVEASLPEFGALVRERAREIAPPELRRTVAGIVDAVRARGDAALCEFTRQFDHYALEPRHLRLSAKELAVNVPATLRKALQQAMASVRAYHRRQLRQDWTAANSAGAETGEIFRPVERAGMYIPAGTAPLVSTVLMTVIPAQVAGVKEICVASPPGPDGALSPGILAACRACGINEVYRMGGAQAIAALAFGTETVKRVDVIAGPGNRYVTEAKRQVFGYVGIDLLAGPSESMIIADLSANPAFVAADLLSQAEHHQSSTYLVAISGLFLDEVEAHLSALLTTRFTSRELQRAVAERVVAVHAASLDQAAQVANLIAPEHLQIVTEHDDDVLRKIRHAGAIFLGHYAPVPLGDYVAGPSHVLPTGGTARYMSGLSTDVFRKRMAVMRFSPAAFARTASAIKSFAAYECLPAHGYVVEVRARKARAGDSTLGIRRLGRSRKAQGQKKRTADISS